jgi:CDP-glucose 4,6-dehydratase
VSLRNPDSIRPWQHVLEPLSGYLMMGERIFQDDKYLWAYNFGPDISDTMRVEDIVKKAIQILWKGEYQVQKDESMHEAWLLLLDNTKSKILLGWSPQFWVDEALDKTFEWYNAYLNWSDMRQYSLEAISQFTQI